MQVLHICMGFRAIGLVVPRGKDLRRVQCAAFWGLRAFGVSGVFRI